MDVIALSNNHASIFSKIHPCGEPATYKISGLCAMSFYDVSLEKGMFEEIRSVEPDVEAILNKRGMNLKQLMNTWYRQLSMEGRDTCVLDFNGLFTTIAVRDLNTFALLIYASSERMHQLERKKDQTEQFIGQLLSEKQKLEAGLSKIYSDCGWDALCKTPLSPYLLCLLKNGISEDDVAHAFGCGMTGTPDDKYFGKKARERLIRTYGVGVGEEVHNSFSALYSSGRNSRKKKSAGKEGTTSAEIKKLYLHAKGIAELINNSLVSATYEKVEEFNRLIDAQEGAKYMTAQLFDTHTGFIGKICQYHGTVDSASRIFSQPVQL